MGKINNNSLNQITLDTDGDGDLKLQVNNSTGMRLNANLALGLGNTVSYGSAGQVLTSNGVDTAPYWQSLSFAPTNNATFTGNTTISETGIVRNTIEKTTVAATALTGTVNVDLIGNTVQFFTANASANWTFNFRANSTVTANTFLSNGDSASIVLLVTQGATAYYPNSHTIDGAAVTPKWQGGTTPVAGSSASIDAYTYTIVKTAAATYTVFASQTQFA